MSGTAVLNKQNKANAYLVKEILESTPQKLLLKLYDFAIVNCQKNNMAKTNNAISELINALNFEHPEAKEVSIGLMRLYQYAQDEMRKGNNEMALHILTELRNAWQNIFRAA